MQLREVRADLGFGELVEGLRAERGEWIGAGGLGGERGRREEHGANEGREMKSHERGGEKKGAIRLDRPWGNFVEARAARPGGQRNLYSTESVNERPRGSATRGSQLLPAPVSVS